MKVVLDVKKIKLEQLNSVEYAHFIKSMLDLVKSVGLEHLNLEEEAYKKLLKCHEDLTEATRQSRYSKETQKINELDKKRSEYVVFLLPSFRIEQKNPSENRRESAKILHKTLKNYAGIQSLPLGQKTQTIEGFLVDIKKPELAPHLKTLELENAVKLLAETNAECHKLTAGRAESQISKVLINSKKVRKEATELYRYFVKCVSGQHIVSQSEESANFINLLNKLVSDTMNANKQRLAQALINKKAVKPVETKTVSE